MVLLKKMTKIRYKQSYFFYYFLFSIFVVIVFFSFYKLSSSEEEFTILMRNIYTFYMYTCRSNNIVFTVDICKEYNLFMLSMIVIVI